jgi:hypothetical protein
MSPNDIQHFLVVYDVTHGPATVEEFGSDYEAALAAYTEREHEYRERDGVDIVLLGADSLETIKQTHSSYFEPVDGFERFFEPAAS